MSRPDHTPRVAVDFAAPLRRPHRGRRALIFVTVIALSAGALLVAVGQLLLR
ncbi:MAG: hypothetical protein M3077_03600 [Candidatus Dormibacteraeota bacterium]|nr:hypothetical protein [Candidatus Dormibacteraeota bacterium]